MPFAGICVSYLLRSDGVVVCFGSYWDEIKTLGSADRGMTFKQVSAGGEHVLLLRNYGRVMGCIIDVPLHTKNTLKKEGPGTTQADYLGSLN